MDTLVIRPEEPRDRAAIADLNDRAFAGSAESTIIDRIRQAGHPIISLVAESAGAIAGHIFFSPVKVESAVDLRALGLGPMAVLPERQRGGIGSKLVEAGLRESARQGYAAVVVLGHTGFYPRFGFHPARVFGLRSEYADAGDAFMAIELAPNALSGCGGLVRYLPEFAECE